MSDDDPMLSAALAYGAMGVAVFSVKSDKKPFRGSHGWKDATTDPERLRAMWAAHPNALIAAATGQISGLVLVDVDVGHVAGVDGHKTLKRLGLSLSTAITALTPNNGTHGWFALPPGVKLKSTNGEIGPGVDTRGEGGYGVLPPSRPDPKKAGYHWINGGDLTKASALPDEFIKLLTRTPEERRFLEDCERLRSSAPIGKRHETLVSITMAWAHKVVAGRLAEDFFRSQVTDAGLACGKNRLEVEAALESALRKARGSGTASGASGAAATASVVVDAEPWDEEVDGGVALNEAIAQLNRHVFMTPYQQQVTAIWALHTHLVDAFFHSPRLNVFSPVKRCGKSTLKRLVSGMVTKAVYGENISPAVIYHVADAHRPTFLFDEVHLLLSHRNGDRPALYSLMNAGCERTGATWRMQGEGTAMAPKQFRVFAPMLIAGIGRIGGSLGDRSIPIQLKRKTKDEPIEVFDFESDQDGLVETSRKFARWAQDNIAAVRAVKLDKGDFPAGWDDRQCDCARPLLKIATVLGQSWLEAVRNALVEVWRTAAAADLEEDDNQGPALLADIAAVFNDLYRADYQREEALRRTGQDAAWISSADLVEKLVQDELKPWVAMGRMQRPLTQNRLARVLCPYKIAPQLVGPKRLSGYLWRQFIDAWGRYT